MSKFQDMYNAKKAVENQHKSLKQKFDTIDDRLSWLYKIFDASGGSNNTMANIKFKSYSNEIKSALADIKSMVLNKE